MPPPDPTPHNTVSFDETFFDKGAVRVGTLFRYAGMRNHAARWRVVKIETYVRLPSGRFALRPTDEIKHLSDLVYLELVTPNPEGYASRRRATFGALRYSAVWRVA